MTSGNTNFENDRSNLGVVNDPNLKIKPGEKLKHYLKSSKLNFGPLLTADNIDELREELQSKKLWLNEYLVGSEVILPELEIPERNPELEKRVQKLRNSLDAKEYRRMTKNVDLTSRFKSEDSVGVQIKQINSGLIGVFQFVVSVAAAFAFGFIGIDVFFGMTLDLAVRLLLGIICALIVGAADLYFLAMNLAVSETDYVPPTSSPRKKPLTVTANAEGTSSLTFPPTGKLKSS